MGIIFITTQTATDIRSFKSGSRMDLEWYVLAGVCIVILNHVSPAGRSQSGQLMAFLRQSGKLFHAVKRCASGGGRSGRTCDDDDDDEYSLRPLTDYVYTPTNPGTVFHLRVVHVKKISVFGARCLIVIARICTTYI